MLAVKIDFSGKVSAEFKLIVITFRRLDEKIFVSTNKTVFP